MFGVSGMLGYLQIHKGAFREERNQLFLSVCEIRIRSNGLEQLYFPCKSNIRRNCKPVDTQAVELVKGAVDSSTGNSQGFD